MKNRFNRSYVLHFELGENAIKSEESELRAQIDRKVAPDNDRIMAFPYPKNYGMTRQVWTNLFVDKDSDGNLCCEYSVTFYHACLLWKHCRVYSLSHEEYESLTADLTNKYGMPSLSVFEPTESWHIFNQMMTWRIKD